MNKSAIGCIVVILLSVAIAGAVEVSPPSQLMDQAQFGQAMDRVRAATIVVVHHEVKMHDPAPFATAIPCEVPRTVADYKQGLAGSQVVTLRDRLGVDQFTSAPSSPAPSPCRGDSIRTESLELAFGTGNDAVYADVRLGCGTIAWRWGERWTWQMSLAGRAPRILEFLAANMPKDKSLVGQVACDRDSAAPVRPGELWPGDMVDVEELPEAIHKPPPSYPDDAREHNIEGTVMIQALVSKRGEVLRTRIAKSIPELDAAAVRSVERWTFRPAKSRGKPVSVWVAMPVTFRLH